VLLHFDMPLIDTSINTPPEAAIVVIAVVYVIAAAFNLAIPDTGARYPQQRKGPWRLLVDFSECFTVLWKDKLGQISLATTTLFWGAGATLQFIVLKWAEKSLNLPLTQGAVLQGISAFGIALGAVLAARYVPLKRAVHVLPYGITLGFVVMAMIFVHWMPLVYVLLVVVGGLAGFFVVPMNALLQHRGHVLMGAGHSIAVQNFNENIGILAMVGLYSIMLSAGLDVRTAIVLFGLFVSGIMVLVMLRHRRNQARGDLLHLIGAESHGGH
jgi:hypothetical protein